MKKAVDLKELVNNLRDNFDKKAISILSRNLFGSPIFM